MGRLEELFRTAQQRFEDACRDGRDAERLKIERDVLAVVACFELIEERDRLQRQERIGVEIGKLWSDTRLWIKGRLDKCNDDERVIGADTRKLGSKIALADTMAEKHALRSVLRLMGDPDGFEDDKDLRAIQRDQGAGAGGAASANRKDERGSSDARRCETGSGSAAEVDERGSSDASRHEPQATPRVAVKAKKRVPRKGF